MIRSTGAKTMRVNGLSLDPVKNQSIVRHLEKMGIRTSLATQKPVPPKILLFSLPTLSLSRDPIFPFSLTIFFCCLFCDPAGGRNKKTPSHFCGWRVGRNPPSVPSSICLIGEPAPQAELTGVYIPFHSAMGARFIPRPALHPGRPGEHPIIVTRYRDGYRFCAPTQALA